MSKCGFVTIIGAPNAGKSTLTNLLVGSKVTIVSPKVQTTRSSIKAIMVEDDTQLIFCDTPGIFKAERKLEKAIVENALEQIAEDMDIVFLLDASHERNRGNEIILQQLKTLKKKTILAINKIDLVGKDNLLPIVEKYHQMDLFDQIFLISASKDDGVDDLKKYLLERAPDSPFLYPEDQLTDISSRFLAQEITREKLFLILRKELPYNISVETETWYEGEDGIIKIDQTIYVMKESQKRIVIGHKGENLKKIGVAARKELSKILGSRVNIFLHVKVKEDWLEKEYMYKHMGLKFPK